MGRTDRDQTLAVIAAADKTKVTEKWIETYRIHVALEAGVMRGTEILVGIIEVAGSGMIMITLAKMH